MVDGVVQPTPSAEAVRAALERILTSEPFRPSAQLRVFLRFVVETTLSGGAERIRAFTIAVEAFGRDEDFNPQSDPIVRVEAARLRRAMEQYYAGPGADDPVEIVVPRGGYVPRFHARAAPPQPAVGASAPAPPVITRPRAIAAALSLLLVGAVLSGVLLLRQRGDPAATQAAADARPSMQGRSPLPLVSIEPVAPAGPLARELDAIRAKLVDALARFDEIDVAAEPPAASGAARAPSMYRLTVAAERQADGTASPMVQLIDAAAGTVVWTRSFERFRLEGNLAATSEAIAREVAPTLAQPYGVIYAHERTVRSDSERDSRYQCLIDAIEYRRTLETARHPEIRRCLERTIAADPTFPGAHAALAFLTLREYYAGETRDPRVLDLGLRAAMRAVELKPGSARAHHALMNVLFARGSIAAALVEGERTITLNPYDMTGFIGYGLRLAFAERAAEGLELLERAAQFSPARPPVLEFALFVVHYALRDHARAAHHAGMLVGDAHPLVLIARALVAINAGERAQAQASVDRLFALHPAWRIGPRREIERFIPAGHVVDRIVRDLAPLGFSTTN